jgi:hypothetical protein
MSNINTRIEDIIVALRAKLRVPIGRHLYGVLGDYTSLHRFEREIENTTITDGEPFSRAESVNEGIINRFSDEQFRTLVNDEAKRPEPTRASIGDAFEAFIRERLENNKTLIIKDLELVFIYNIDLSVLRVLSTDQYRVILLLPGKRIRDRIQMFPHSNYDFSLPRNLIAENHTWEISQT